MKISGVYKITNTVTCDSYIGSSKNVKRRWADHKCPSTWKKCPNNPMYIDMMKHGVDKFEFQVITEVEPEKLKETEQEFIETLKPTYNSNRANGWDFERHKETHRKSSSNYENQICCYNGETLTLCALSMRFKRSGVSHPTLEAKKYIIPQSI